MRKLMLLSVASAVALLVAAPAALAQEFGQESTSGNVALENSLKDDAGRCAAILQAVNTSNVQNAQGGTLGGGGGDQYDDDDDEGGSIEIDGSSLTISPELERECKDTINKSTPKAKAGEVKGEAKAGKAEAKAGEAKAGGAEAKAGKAKAGGAEAKAGKAEAKAEPAPTPEVQAETPKAETPKAEAPKAEAKPSGVQAKELPRTGGSSWTSLLALGVGVLLVGGGLAARRYLL